MHCLLRALAALALAVVGVGVVPAPATAAYCSGSGIHIVVERGSLGGGTTTACFPTTSGVTGSTAVSGAGFDLDYTLEYASVLCRIDGLPADTNCRSMPPADAYWALFEATGSGWSYSSSSIMGARLDPGDSYALVWQGTASRQLPQTAPGPRVQPTSTPTPTPTPTSGGQPTSTPTAQPTKQPGGKPTGQPSQQPSTSPSEATQPEATTTAAPEPTAAAEASRTKGKSNKNKGKSGAAETSAPMPSGQDSTTAGEPVESGTAAVQAEQDRLPASLTLGVLGLLAAAVVASAVVARRRRTG